MFGSLQVKIFSHRADIRPLRRNPGAILQRKSGLSRWAGGAAGQNFFAPSVRGAERYFPAEKNASVGDGGGVVWLFFYLRSMCRRTTSTTSRKPAREMAAVERKTMFTPAATPLAAVRVS